MNPGVSWVLLAAGASSRFGGGTSKLFAPINGVRLIDLTIRSLKEALDAPIILVSTPEFHEESGLKLPWVAGGLRRRDSANLGTTAAQSEIVLIHDAARPFISRAVVERLLAAAKDFDGVAPGLPVTDTIKRVVGNAVVETLKRSELVAVQTPQAVRRDAMLKAFETVNPREDYTDDLAVLAAAGFRTGVVEGDSRNMKITTKEDIALAENSMQLFSSRN